MYVSIYLCVFYNSSHCLTLALYLADLMFTISPFTLFFFPHAFLLCLDFDFKYFSELLMPTLFLVFFYVRNGLQFPLRLKDSLHGHNILESHYLSLKTFKNIVLYFSRKLETLFSFLSSYFHL